MKKSLIILAAAVLTLILGTVSLAAPVTPNGIQATALMDFTNLEDGEKTFGDLGFWGPDFSQKVTVSNGLVIIAQGVWGAFPSFNEEQMNILKSADGLGFYVEAGEADAIICCGFNADTGLNHILAENKTVYLADKDGKVTSATTFYLTDNNQSAITVPANFKGYLYFPYDNFITNDANAAPFDTSSLTVQTLIFSVGFGSDVAYGEIYAYSGEYTPETETPEEGGNEDDNKEPSREEGDLSVLSYAAAAVSCLGGITFIRKKR